MATRARSRPCATLRSRLILDGHALRGSLKVGFSGVRRTAKAAQLPNQIHQRGGRNRKAPERSRSASRAKERFCCSMTNTRIVAGVQPAKPFAEWQPIYAQHGIATFPVSMDGKNKRPAIRGYDKVGLRGSEQLAFKFAQADALGFMCGSHSKISVGDIDTTNERTLADFLDRHGQTPIIAKTASGKFHAWYRHNGERRQIRPWPERPFDILGGGFIVVPPSRAPSGSYQFIQGSLDDVERLPIMRSLDARLYAKTDKPRQGERNNRLWRHCMKIAHRVDSFDDLLDVARTFNDDCLPPMEDNQVITAAQSAWDYTQRGENRFGQHGAWMAFDEIATMAEDPDSFTLLAFLRANQGPAATFMCANGLAERFGWHRIPLRKRAPSPNRPRLLQAHQPSRPRPSSHVPLGLRGRRGSVD